VKKKVWANLQRIIELFTEKMSLSSQKYGFAIRDPEKSYSGSRIQGSKRHRIPDRICNTENYPVFMVMKEVSHEKIILLKV
jgi:hypothetical protein